MLHKSSACFTQEKIQITALLTTLLFLGSSFLMTPAAAAQERTSRSPISAEKKVFTAEESKSLGDAARRRDQARQHEWDRKMKEVSKGICAGC